MLIHSSLVSSAISFHSLPSAPEARVLIICCVTVR
nr:MAG TPA: hypothetical protein [Caudoviricetes sp.]